MDGPGRWQVLRLHVEDKIPLAALARKGGGRRSSPRLRSSTPNVSTTTASTLSPRSPACWECAEPTLYGHLRKSDTVTAGPELTPDSIPVFHG